MKHSLQVLGGLVLLTAGLTFLALQGSEKHHAEYQQLRAQWKITDDTPMLAQQRTHVSKSVWFGEGEARRQMLLEAHDGKLQVSNGRLLEQLNGVHAIWQERFLGESLQLIEELNTEEALYDYGRSSLRTKEVSLARFQANGRRLNAKEQTKSPLMNAVAESSTIHIGSPPRMEAQSLRAKIFQSPS